MRGIAVATIVASMATMNVATMMVATTSTRFERCAAFDMTILFGCSAGPEKSAGWLDVGRRAVCGGMLFFYDLTRGR
ncbi:hypothetical protein NXC14_CH00498 [Rhizobium sp. NXC14]|nr:hypothetical protein NXC14_CH00498 [Rhizobium sp. NXC14]